MPVTKSAKKALKRSEKNREVNSGFKNQMKTTLKTIRKTMRPVKGVPATPDAKVMADLVQQAYSHIDLALRKKVIHKNTAARRKSRVTKSINKFLAA